MKDDIQEVNVRALEAVTTLLLGEEGVGLAHKLYRALDKAQTEGWQQGLEAGFEDGYAQAKSDELFVGQNEFEDGYIAGVQDARINPAEADANIANIIKTGAIVMGDEFSGDFYEGDSGDETKLR